MRTPATIPGRRLGLVAAGLWLAFGAAQAEKLTLLHVGDQESWLLSAQGNLRDDPSQAISFYGGVDRLATVIGQAGRLVDNAITPVPEPQTYALLFSGLVLLGAVLRRRRAA